jgi:hypothetical protein
LGRYFSLQSSYLLEINEHNWVNLQEGPSQTFGKFQTALRSVPEHSLVVFLGSGMNSPSSWSGALPSALKPPFASIDLSTRTELITTPDASCCSAELWWNDIKSKLQIEPHNNMDDRLRLYLITWRAGEKDFKSQLIPRRLISVRLIESLGQPVRLDAVRSDQ